MTADRLDVFMARANAAYYASHDPFQDFTTAPEISQVFGELLGAWAAVVWDQMSRPDTVMLVEAGPGRGTLMADALRGIARVAPEFHDALQVHFIETSPRLQAIQAEHVPDATWHTELRSLPQRSMILLANEFLDALPIRQYEYRNGTWNERFVRDGAFVLEPAPKGWQAEEGDVVEVAEAAEAWMEAVASRIVRHRGAALILDYGPATVITGESLQAIRDGAMADPLAEPGSADLTAYVPFPKLLQTARREGADCHGPLMQGEFLSRIGLRARTEALVRANPVRTAALREAATRLAAPDRMGAIFKAAAITHLGAPKPPGFET
jgi:SAM-dependent MidA family methyltransferase